MSSLPVVVVDGELWRKLPARFQSDPRFQEGATLELVPVNGRDRSSLFGIAANVQADPNGLLEEERLRELDDQGRWRRD